MDDVVRDKFNIYSGALGDVEGISDGNVLGRILELPPPLVSNGLHCHGTCRRLQLEHSVDGACQYSEQEERRCNRPDKFDSIIAMQLSWLRRVRTSPVADDG